MKHSLLVCIISFCLSFFVAYTHAAEKYLPKNSAILEQTYQIKSPAVNTFNYLSDIHSYQYLMPYFSQIKVQSTYQLNSLEQQDEFVAISAKSYGPISIEQYSIGTLLVDKEHQTIQLQWRKANGDSIHLLLIITAVDDTTRIEAKTLLLANNTDDLSALLLKEQAAPSVRFDVLRAFLEEGYLIDVHACQSQLNRYCF